jgi:hypothetical protein
MKCLIFIISQALKVKEFKGHTCITGYHHLKEISQCWSWLTFQGLKFPGMVTFNFAVSWSDLISPSPMYEYRYCIAFFVSNKTFLYVKKKKSHTCNGNYETKLFGSL